MKKTSIIFAVALASLLFAQTAFALTAAPGSANSLLTGPSQDQTNPSTSQTNLPQSSTNAPQSSTNPPQSTTNPPQSTTNANTGATSPSSALGTIPNPLNGVNSLSDLFYKIVNLVVSISYVVVAFFLILSGFKFVTAQGNESKLEDAKSTFFHTVIGAFIVIGAQVIIDVVKSIFTSFVS
ncbi:MAG: hypothetical protein KGI79_00865 [Patescibacteria group bacterium]|nr:hypothetical protein [Patescibacteria group bacterium]MDE2116414.1 hypothetical protein [Patescibacteria group bacterium]